MSRIVEEICVGVGFAARISSPGGRLHVDRTHFSRTDDALRRAAVRPTRIFICRNARASDPGGLEKLQSQKISIREAGSLAGVIAAEMLLKVLSRRELMD